MSEHSCCGRQAEIGGSNDAKPTPGLLRRAWRGVQWLTPAALLVLMPKCPMCVTAYVALFTGVSITVPAARSIQTLMLVFCLTSLAYLGARLWRERIILR